MTTINTRIVNSLTGEVVTDTSFEISEYNFTPMKENAEIFADHNPDCTVQLWASNGDFVSLMPRNQEVDELMVDSGTMSELSYCAKWYPDAFVEAQCKAAEIFKAKKRYEVDIVLCEKNGEQVVHATNF